MSKQFTGLFLLLSLAVVAALLYLRTPEPAAMTTEKDNQVAISERPTPLVKDNPASTDLMTPNRPAKSTQDDYTVFRGDRFLTGYSAEKLPARFKVNWEFKSESSIPGSPIVVRETVYVASMDGFLYALDAATGGERWKYSFAHGSESTPLFLNGVLYCGAHDGALHALEAATGKDLWKYQTGSKITGAANFVRITTADGTEESLILFGSHDNNLHCIDLKGQQRWICTTKSFVNGTPAIVNGNVVFGGCDGIVRVVDARSGETRSSVDLGSYIPGSVATDGKYIFAGTHDSTFVCIDLASLEIVWKNRIGAHPIASSPAVDRDLVIIGSADRRLYCFDLANGEEKWHFGTRGRIDCPPIACGGRIVTGSKDGQVYILTREGEVVWQYGVGSAIVAAPVYKNGTLLVATTGGRLLAFSADE